MSAATLPQGPVVSEHAVRDGRVRPVVPAMLDARSGAVGQLCVRVRAVLDREVVEADARQLGEKVEDGPRVLRVQHHLRVAVRRLAPARRIRSLDDHVRPLDRQATLLVHRAAGDVIVPRRDPHDGIRVAAVDGRKRRDQLLDRRDLVRAQQARSHAEHAHPGQSPRPARTSHTRPSLTRMFPDVEPFQCVVEV